MARRDDSEQKDFQIERSSSSFRNRIFFSRGRGKYIFDFASDSVISVATCLFISGSLAHLPKPVVRNSRLRYPHLAFTSHNSIKSPISSRLDSDVKDVSLVFQTSARSNKKLLGRRKGLSIFIV